jgi:hypothetical protein
MSNIPNIDCICAEESQKGGSERKEEEDNDRKENAQK